MKKGNTLFKIRYTNEHNYKCIINNCWLSLTKGKNTIMVGMNGNKAFNVKGYCFKPCILFEKYVKLVDTHGNSMILSSHM